MKTLDTCKEGDILTATNGDKAVILSRTANLIARSTWWDYNAFGAWLTLEEAKIRDYRILQDNLYPMTRKEIEDLYRVKVTD